MTQKNLWFVVSHLSSDVSSSHFQLDSLQSIHWHPTQSCVLYVSFPQDMNRLTNRQTQRVYLLACFSLSSLLCPSLSSYRSTHSYQGSQLENSEIPKMVGDIFFRASAVNFCFRFLFSSSKSSLKRGLMTKLAQALIASTYEGTAFRKKKWSQKRASPRSGVHSVYAVIYTVSYYSIQ